MDCSSTHPTSTLASILVKEDCFSCPLRMGRRMVSLSALQPSSSPRSTRRFTTSNYLVEMYRPYQGPSVIRGQSQSMPGSTSSLSLHHPLSPPSSPHLSS